MMRKKTLLSIIFIGAVVALIISDISYRFIKKDIDTKINLRWVKAYKEENWDKVKIGLAWSLSFLGAELPKGAMDKAIIRQDSSLFSLDLSELGFERMALEKLSIIVDSLKKTEEYKRMKGIDLGRFIVLTLHSSNHYYQITGAEDDINSFIKKHQLYNYSSLPIIKSGVAKGNRMVKFRMTSHIDSIAFIAEESHGKIMDNKFHPEIIEVFDIMKNGQFRFAIYNKYGKLISATPQEYGGMFGGAGKPGKCLWCHEITVMPFFMPTEEVSGYATQESFQICLDSAQRMINTYRNTLNSDIDFNQKQDHTYAELLYISFMEPSLFRLSNEWQRDSLAVKAVLSPQDLHSFKEFPFLGNSLYHRKNIDKMAPYKSVDVPHSVREDNSFEPQFFHDSRE